MTTSQPTPTKKEIRDKNFIPMCELEAALEKLQYGWTTVTVRVNGGKITDIVGNQFKTLRYKDGRSADAVAELLSEIKQNHDNKVSGSISLTIIMEKGNVRQLTLQKAMRRSYRWEKTT